MANNEISAVAAASQNQNSARYAQMLDAAPKKAAREQAQAGREETLETQSAKAAEKTEKAPESNEQQSSKIDLTA